MTQSAATLALLEWIESRPRTYEETIEAWRTSCPRLATWDDAVSDGLVRVDLAPGRDPRVTLTPAGRALLEGRAEQTTPPRSPA